jgi:GntR family transcriptional regulator
MYRQIAEDLRQKVQSGVIGPGSQLPTELALREEYDASRNTVRDAVKWLINLGLVATRPGQGTFVIEKMDPFATTLSGDSKTGFGSGEGTSYLAEVSDRKRAPTTTRIRVEIREATPDVAE